MHTPRLAALLPLLLWLTQPGTGLRAQERVTTPALPTAPVTTLEATRQTLGQRLPVRETASPDSKAHRFEQLADPFEVSPQLRDGRRTGNAFGGLPGAGQLELQRRIQLRALLVIAGQRVAQLSIRDKDKDSITVHDRELVDLGDLGIFEARIERGSVTLTNPSAPQGTKLILR